MLSAQTTVNPAHETLALATLLDLPYQDTKIATAGVTRLMDGIKEAEKNKTLDELFRAFWELFHKKYPGSIPAGLIFLEGEKVDQKGYGWAPRTFMSICETDYPDPMAPVQRPGYRGTSIDKDWGLHVRYPGFILHSQHGKKIRNKILFTDSAQGTLEFPGSGSLLDWYHVEAADNKPYTDQLSLVIERRTQLAIILTRPNPREDPAEIGLLVEIYKTTRPRPPHLEPNDELPDEDKTSATQSYQRPRGDVLCGRRVAYCCQLIRRVKIRRDSSRVLSSANSLGHGHCCQMLRRAHRERHSENTDASNQDTNPSCRCEIQVVCETHPNSGLDPRDNPTLAEPPLLRLMPKNLKPESMNGVDDDLLCIGQALDQDQEWYVDGFQRERENQIEDSRRAVKAPTSGWVVSKLGRVFGIRSGVTSPSRQSAPASSEPGAAVPTQQLRRTNTNLTTSSQQPRGPSRTVTSVSRGTIPHT